MAEGAEGVPVGSRYALESLSRQQGPSRFPDEDAFPILPQIKPWLLQHLPQNSVCITSYWGRAVWELLLLAECSCQQRDYSNPLPWGVNQQEAALRAVIASAPLYWSTSKVNDSQGNIISPTKQWSKYIVFSILYLLSISLRRVMYLIQTPWSHTSLVQPFSIIYWTMEVGMNWVLPWSIISSFSNWVSKRWCRCIEVTTC